jgi:hypothetical protein
MKWKGMIFEFKKKKITKWDNNNKQDLGDFNFCLGKRLRGGNIYIYIWNCIEGVYGGKSYIIFMLMCVCSYLSL